MKMLIKFSNNFCKYSTHTEQKISGLKVEVMGEITATRVIPALRGAF